MRTFAGAIGALLLTLTAATAIAQPGRPGLADGRGARPIAASPTLATADFLLAHTGDLALTDAQVVRLAAIARRVDTRRKATATRLDSLRALERAWPDSAGPGRRPAGPPPAELQQTRDRLRADVRDAIAVLTPDQQATAWLMIAGRGALGGPLGTGDVRDDAAGPPDRGPISRPPAARDVPRRNPGPEQVTP